MRGWSSLDLSLDFALEGGDFRGINSLEVLLPVCNIFSSSNCFGAGE